MRLSTLLLLIACSRCVANATEIEYLTWDEARAQCKADGKPIVALLCAGWCGPCRTMKDRVFPALHGKRLLANAHVCAVDVDKQRKLFDALKRGDSIPQLLISDLKHKRVHVGMMTERETYDWLTGKHE